ncbi:hypothetical protein HA052_07735 [Chromobacterium haemolyticum]|uniref:Type I restriction modification DNA specificity domain-containing protein n=1 Tax=Chromobacterium fluminis TaxID=3044269 RepID=A0ABX0L007_9NEIS|nr:restriction endonuclease subunit S [Chromobacterium haemolyticum]NHR05089.1 hypothetical protein [Chromobacterium haemolyticum]
MSSKNKTAATTEETKPALVPKLRFPEFRGANGWPPQRLGSVAIFFKGKGLPKSALIPDGERPCIHYGELFTVYPEVIDVVRSRTKLEEDVFLSLENDVLMPTSDVTPSGLAKACCLNVENVILGGDILVIRTNKHSINGEFLARYIRHLERQVLQLVSGSTVFHLYASSMKNLALSLPSERAEQQKIAECLSSVDELIAAQARKVDALKTHKKGLMQQLFPREGETQPRLRLPEFINAGAWIRTPLGNLCTRIMDGTHFSPKSKEGPRPYLTSKNIKDGRIDLSNLSYISEEEHADIFRKCPVKPHDVLLTKDGANTGNCALNNLDFDFSLLSSVAVLRGDPNKLSQEFLFQSILSDAVQSLITESMAGQAITRITLAKIAGFLIPVTSLNEQQRIASCLRSLDALITAEAQKVEALKTHKKGLMQQLFPFPEEAK